MTEEQEYPAFNVIKLPHTQQLLEVAVTGFSADDLHVHVRRGVLIIQGDLDANPFEDCTEEPPEYHYKGIPSHEFKRSFYLHADRETEIIEVVSASLANGILSIILGPGAYEPGPLTIGIEV